MCSVDVALALMLAQALLCPVLSASEDPKLMFLRAREMQESNGGNDSAGAVTLFKKVVAALPSSAEAHLRLSEALLEVQDIGGALSAVKKAVALSPKNAEAATNLAVIEFAIAKNDAKNSDTAKAALLRATRLAPSDPELWFRLADICESTEDGAGALNAWLHLGSLRPQMFLGEQPVYIVAYERAAYLAFTLSRYNERREACLALGREPKLTDKHLRALEELARNQVELGYLSHAEESFTLLSKHLSTEPAVWQNIALIQRQTDRFDEAIQSLQRAQSIRPDPKIIVQQAICYMNAGRLSEAYDMLQVSYNKPELVENNTQRDYLRNLIAACLLMLNRPNDLLKLMKTWEILPDNAFLSAQRAQALIKANDLKAARLALKHDMQKYSGNPIFKRALSIPKNVFEGSLSRGSEGQKAMKLLDLEATAYTFAEFRQWGRCLENIQEINKLSPIKDVELLLLQSNALEYLNRREEAYSILRQCQRLNPSHATIQNNLGYHMLEFGGDIQDASQLIKAALDQEPNNSSYMDSWGWALFKQGMFKEAEEVLQRAVEANPFSPETRKHLGETLIKLNRPQEALEQWERALAFIFPDRIKVEEWVKNLRTELAKKALEESEPEEISSDEDEDGYDDGW